MLCLPTCDGGWARIAVIELWKCVPFHSRLKGRNSVTATSTGWLRLSLKSSVRISTQNWTQDWDGTLGAPSEGDGQFRFTFRGLSGAAAGFEAAHPERPT